MDTQVFTLLVACVFFAAALGAIGGLVTCGAQSRRTGDMRARLDLIALALACALAWAMVAAFAVHVVRAYW